MARNEEERTAYYAREELQFVYEEVERQRQKNDRVAPRPGYLVELSGEAIPLEEIEFRILTFLSASPYRAYTRRQIIEAVQTDEMPVSEDALDEHIRTLRDKLGLFSDYVQSVPHVGYRFKA